MTEPEIELEPASQEVTKHLGFRGKVAGYFNNGAKVAALIGGLVIAAAAFYPRLRVFGDIAAADVVISTFIMIIAEKDSSIALAAARTAMDKALKQKKVSDAQAKEAADMEANFQAEISRLDQLQAARDFCRQAFEQVILSPQAWDEASMANSVFRQTERPLKLAFGFGASDRYAICIYKTRPNEKTKRPELKLIAHRRAIDCDIEKARVWPIAVGIAGGALALGRNLVEPNLLLPEVKRRYGLDTDDSRDDQFHLSGFAGPIWASSTGQPWGVLVITVNRFGHFNDDDDPTYAEVAKSLAGMLSLAMNIVQAKQRRRL